MLEGVDIASIYVFHRMMEDRCRKTASEKLGITLTNLAYHLKKIRELSGDVLFDGKGKELLPTPRAVDLHKHVKQAITLLETGFNADQYFSHLETRKHFSIFANEYFSHVVLPKLIDKISAVSNSIITISVENIDLEFSSKDSNKKEGYVHDMLATGEVDIFISSNVLALERPNIVRRKLLDDNIDMVTTVLYISYIPEKKIVHQ
ncbi:MAG: LysR family transcriptional regulator [Colwellia sp.]|nr:LysR family transcriptional regulator [Colwellia sp.]